jgi:hypothetical protein
MTELTTLDKIALYVGGGLVVLGVPVIGLLEMALGAGHPVDAEGAIVHEALVPIDIRGGIILVGFLIWGLYAVAKVLVGRPSAGPTGAAEAQTAD